MKHYKPSGSKAKKRLLALVLALALVCSSLMSVYANGVATMDDDFFVDDGFGMDDDFGVDDEPEWMGHADGITEKKDSLGNIVYEYGKDTIFDWTGDDAIASPYPDGEQMDPGFAIPTITYRFWLSEKDDTALEAFNEEVASGVELYGMTEAEYIDLYGPNDGMFSAVHIADGGSLWDNSFKNPTAADAPDAGKPNFAGWYTVDEYGYQRKFTFDANCDQTYVEAGVVHTGESATVDVFARWSANATDTASQPVTNPKFDDTLDDHTYDKWYAALVSSSDSAFQGLLEKYTDDEGFCEYLDNLPEDEIKYLSEKIEATAETIPGTETVEVGKTVTLTKPSTTTNGSSYQWRIADGSDKITLSTNPGNQSATVTGKAVGDAVVQYGCYTNNGAGGGGPGSGGPSSNRTWTTVASWNITVTASKKPRTVRVNGQITLTVDVAQRNNYQWKVTSGTGSIRDWTEDTTTANNVTYANLTLYGDKVGTVVVEYGYYTNSNWTALETFEINVIKDETYEPLYLYALHPGETKNWKGDGTYNAPSYWYGIGIAKVKEGVINFPSRGGIASSIQGEANIQAQIDNGNVVLEPYSGSYTYYRTSGEDKLPNTYTGLSFYPDLEYDGITYKYWDGTGQTPEYLFYVLEYVELKLANGANAGVLGDPYNYPEVPSVTKGDKNQSQYPARHLDMTVHFSTDYRVQFATVEPDASEYVVLDPLQFSAEHKGEDLTSTIVRPEQRMEEDKYLYPIEERDGYTFKGWYLDKDLTIEAKFDGTSQDQKTVKEAYDYQQSLIKRGYNADSIPTTVTYYAKWEPKAVTATTVRIEKIVAGANGDQTKAFNFAVSVTKDGKSVTGVTAEKWSEGITYDNVSLERFTLKHGDCITLSNVPIGATVTVTETGATGYMVSATAGTTPLTANAAGGYEYVVNGATTDSNPNHITVTNTKEPDPTTTVTITKDVDGLIGDRTNPFSFAVTFADKDGNAITSGITASDTNATQNSNVFTFALKHGEKITFSGVPIGAKVTVTETGLREHTMTAEANVGEEKENFTIGTDNSFTYKVKTPDTAKGVTNAIVVTNTRNILPDAGIDLGSATPYLFLLCVGAVGVATLKRKRER